MALSWAWYLCYTEKDPGTTDLYLNAKNKYENAQNEYENAKNE